MDSIEIQGASIDEAIENGLKQLDVRREKVAVEILALPKKGFFGWRSQNARIRITVKNSEIANESTPSVTDSNRLPPELDTKPTVKLDQVFKTHSRDELRRICQTMPINSLSMAPEIDTSMKWNVEVSLGLASYLARNEQMKEYADLVVPRLVERICSHDPTRIHVKIPPELEEFAKTLVERRSTEAIKCLKFLKTTEWGSNIGRVDYWIFASLSNVAFSSDNPDDARAALDAAKKVPDSLAQQIPKALLAELEKRISHKPGI